MRPKLLLRIALAALWIAPAVTLAQEEGLTKYWTGGDGAWADAAHWSLSPEGPGGAGAPRAQDHAVIARPVRVRVRNAAVCNDLRVGAGARLEADPRSELAVGGHLRMEPSSAWNGGGTLRMVQRQGGVAVDARGARIDADMIIDGGGAFDVQSDLALAGHRLLVLRKGSLMLNRSVVQAHALRMEGRQARLYGGEGMLRLQEAPALSAARNAVDPGRSVLVVAGMASAWDDGGEELDGQRDINVCGTGPGQTAFVVNATVVTSYNGFGVRCRGECNATVTVSVSGGVGPFSYQWLNNGPNTQTWTTACGGPQIVIVTDNGQGISCPVSVNVSEPAPLGVIFFGAGTPPTCPTVCNGSRTALGVGGVSPITYNWNNGAGTGSSFNQLCPGLNTLVVSDANNCTFDTTFFFDLLPIAPNLVVANNSCFGACDGAATVAPTGGTPNYTYVWAPNPPVGQGTASVSGLCAGNWSVTITDANNCDTTLLFVIDEPPPLNIAASITDASCFGTCDGQAGVTVSGSPGPFTYQWSPQPGGGQGTTNATGLCEGAYSLLITDQSTGCDTTLSFTIDAPGAIDVQATVTNATCSDGCDGSITTTTTGGQAPYTYVWSPAPPVGQGTPNASGLCPGPWSLTVADAAGCDTTLLFDVLAPPPIQVTPASTDVTCSGACDGTASVVPVSGGTGAYTFTWAPLPPVGQGTGAVSGLCAGLWSVTVADANGCDTVVTFLIEEPPPVEAVPDQANVTCGGQCDGTASVVVSGGTPQYTYVWSPAPGGGQGTANATGLCASAYTVTITDANGCELVVPFTILDADPFTISLQVQPASCPGSCDGEAGVIVGGAVPPYTYTWSPAPGGGQGTPNVTGLCAGPFLLTIADAVGCDTTIAFTVTEPDPITVNAVVVDASCSDLCNGSIALAVTGGNGIFTYVWSPAPGGGQGTPNATGLCPGTWNVTIASGGCDTTLTFEILAPPPIGLAPASTDVTCAGACDGTASVLPVSGGNGSFTFTWSPAPPAGQGTGAATGLCAGIWSVTVADANGCDTVITFLVQEPPPLEATPTQTNVSCGGACDGTASVVVTGGSPPYTYVWAPAPGGGQGTANATGLCAGDYTVTITDANGCVLVVPFTIQDPAPFTISLQVLPTSCPGVCDGGAGVIVGGGTAPYTYAWSPAPGGGQGTPNVTGLCGGPYLLTIADAVGCDSTISFTVPEPDPITVNAVVVDASCSDLCDGSIALAVTGGNGIYTYAWSPAPGGGQGTPNATGLCPGLYGVTISSGGCDSTFTFEILAPPPLDAVLTIGASACSGDCVASASVTVSGGTPNYTFLWTPAPGGGQGTANATGLCPGNYTVLVQDELGCDTLIAFTITEPPPITVDLALTPAGCGPQCAGTATATVGGGVAPYQYAWAPGVINGQGTPQATGLCVGVYTLTVTDAAGCDTTVFFTIVAPAGILAVPTVTNVACAGDCTGAVSVTATGGVAPYTWNWNPAPPVGQGTPNVSGLCAGPVLLTITDALLCDTALLITISEPPPLEVTGTSTNETCNGPCDGTATVVALGGVGPYAYTWNPAPPTGQGTPSVSGLCAGLWGVTVTDANGCDTTLVFDILPVQPIDAGLVTTDASCANTCDGSVSVTPSNGVAPYTFVWSPEPGTGQGTANATGLCPGNWQVTITDDAGCDTTVLFVIDAPPALQVLLTTQPADCFDPCSGEAGLNISGGVAPYVILWTPGPGAGQGTPVATGLCAGTNYSVTVTDGNGCDTTITFTIDPFDPIVPNSSSTPANCANSCDGTATVGPTGGQAPYTYVWSPAPGGGQGTPQATGLCPGVAEVTITDVDGCSIVASVLILSPDPIDANAVVQDPLCAGRCDGSITTTVSGGVASYTYTWSPVPPNGQGFPVATGLCAGTWTLTISDAAGCDTTLVFVLTEPPPVTLSASSTPSTCQVCTGTGDVVVAGGTPPIGVVWLDALGNTVGSGTSITGLCAGLYTAVATDANGCTAQIGVPVSDADGELLTVDDDETSCPGVCDGGLTAVYTCNEPPCTVTWSNAQGNTVGTGDSISDLCAGTWFAQVENGSGCITIVSAQVLDPTVLQTAISSSPVSCAGLCDGTATVGVTAGTPPYAFNWSPAPGGGQGTPFATGLCAGVYTIDIADGNGCVTTVSVLILEPDPLAVDAVVGDITCADQCDGSITLTTTGGTAPYTWFWNPVPLGQQGSPQLTDICADTWSVSVTDANGCTTSGQWTIAEPDPLLINTTFTPSTCLQCDGAASVSITGGTAPHTAEWFLAGALILVGTDADQLCAGNYTVVVSDANGCVVQSVVTLPDADGETPTPIDGAVGCANDCDGSVAVDLVCTAPPCVLQWTDADGNIIAGDVTSVTDLCTGTYTVQVTNASGCVSFTDVSVLPAQSIVPNLSSTPETCAGLCDGTATVGPAGGVQPYTFTWSPEPGGGQGTPQATGLCAGVYSVLIADAAGCDTTITVLILGPQPIDALGTVADVTCNGDCDGSITVNVAGGVAPYGSLWSPVPGAGQGTLVASSLCAGDWTLSVTDANGCTTAFTWTVTEPDPLAVDLSTVQSQCNDCVGEADAVITGGTAPYITVWGQGAAVIGFGEAITGLCAGIYTLAVTDASGCTLQTTVPIDDVDGEPTSTSDGSLTCPDDCDGTVSVDTPCVDAPCTFAWLDINGNDLGQNSAAATGLCAGSYLVVVTNASGCITIDTANVIAPDPIVANLSTTPASCFGACDGTATVGPTGGAGGYDFFWEPEPINGQGTPQATDLCAGAYTVTITDADGCAIVQGVLILEPPLLEATPIATHPLCADACDGTITVQPSGGTAPYTFVWSPEPPQGQGTAIASELCAGSWSVIISDANGCDTTLSIVLVDPDPLTAVVSTVDNLCAGDCFGEASVTIGGGTAGYTIVWQDDSGATIAQDVATIAALCTGAYTVNVIDANGCAINPSFSILENASIGADVLSTNETCFGPCDGTASITPFGGVGPYSFNWDPEPATGQGTAQVTGLCAGPSTVTITDDLGCSTAVTVTILPFQDIAPNAVVENITCSGSCDGSITLGTTGGNAPYAYAWQPVPPGGNGDPVITGLCAGEWTVTITDATGCTLQASWTVTEPLPLEVTIDAVVDATCQGSLDGSISITTAGGTEPYAWQWTGPAGFTATTEDITGLLAGSYTIAVTDANGCVVALNIDVEAQTTVVADAGADQQDCFGSAFTLDGTESTGAVGYTWTNAQGEVVATTAFADPGPLPPGTHTFTLTVTNGPCASTDQVTITVLALPPADAGPDQTIFISGSVTLGGNPSGPQGAVFSWTPDSTLSAPNVPNPVADPNVTTWYVLTVTDANGCARVDSVLITVLPDLVIFNGFTPNGDGWNDVWIIDNIEEFPECEVEIYNRWGELLFQSLGYRQPWDGRYSGGFVPVGTYYYVVKLNDPRFPDPFTGPLTVIR